MADLEGSSGTSRLLRSAEDRITERIADELRELAGALDGTHRHVDLTSDVELEGGQVAYWVVLRCIRDGLAWDDVRPDRALEATGGVGEVAAGTIARLLQREADLWSTGAALDLAAFAHGTLSLVTGACVAAGVEPRMLIVADLNELRTRRYLEEYFASERAGKPE
jgi:phosphoribosyl-ATP pyrophosphohydrolase